MGIFMGYVSFREGNKHNFPSWLTTVGVSKQTSISDMALAKRHANFAYEKTTIFRKKTSTKTVFFTPTWW